MSKSKSVTLKYRDFLLTFFQGDFYQEKEVNGFWLTKNYDPINDCWSVYVFTKEAFRKYKKFEEATEQKGFLSQV